MKHYVSFGGTIRHIESPDGGVTLCGLELEYMQTALNEYFELPVCRDRFNLCWQIEMTLKNECFGGAAHNRFCVLQLGRRAILMIALMVLYITINMNRNGLRISKSL